MSYAELLIGVYFYKYRIIGWIEEIWNRVMPRKLQLVFLTMLCVVVVIVRRYITTLFVAPVSGMVFIVAYLLAVRNYPEIGKVFGFLGQHSTNVWLTHMFFANLRMAALCTLQNTRHLY